jgi:hypothetical protein
LWLPGRPVSGSTLYRVADVNLLSTNASILQSFCKQLTTPPNKWAPRGIFLITWTFANNDQRRIWVTFTKDYIPTLISQIAGSTKRIFYA